MNVVFVYKNGRKKWCSQTVLPYILNLVFICHKLVLVDNSSLHINDSHPWTIPTEPLQFWGVQILQREINNTVLKIVNVGWLSLTDH